MLVLTFSRKAAEELRDRITVRLGRTTTTPLSSTFHAFCYALLRSCQDAALYEAPLRAAQPAEQDVEAARPARGQLDAPVGTGLAARASMPRSRPGVRREVLRVLGRARELGLWRRTT